MPQIVDKFYKSGLAAFNDGKSMRYVAETLNTLSGNNPNVPPPENKSVKDSDNETFSFMVGFLEGVLMKIRRLR